MLRTSISTGIIGLYLNTWYTGKALKYTFGKQIKDITPSYMTAFIIALSVYFFEVYSITILRSIGNSNNSRSDYRFSCE